MLKSFSHILGAYRETKVTHFKILNLSLEILPAHKASILFKHQFLFAVVFYHEGRVFAL